MSQTFSRYLHPFEIPHHPSLEPEVRQAIVASWSTDWAMCSNAGDGVQRHPQSAAHPMAGSPTALPRKSKTGTAVQR